jgi:hypothetical protein
MKFLSAGILIAFALAAFGQQQSSPQLPPGATPPTFPQPDKDVGRQMPPDTKATAPSAIDVQKQIQDKMDSEPGLPEAKLKAKVTESTVTLTGTVADETQHTAARGIAESYAGPRKIVDKIQVKQ